LFNTLYVCHLLFCLVLSYSVLSSTYDLLFFIFSPHHKYKHLIVHFNDVSSLHSIFFFNILKSPGITHILF
jgi:hypothetical protein